jgi:hypothetical protein
MAANNLDAVMHGNFPSISAAISFHRKGHTCPETFTKNFDRLKSWDFEINFPL